MSAGRGWPAVADEALVEALIPAVQNAIAGGSRTHAGQPDDEIGLSAPDVANVLLMVLATVLETSPGCSTPMGMRLTAEAAGKELAQLMRETRALKAAGASVPKTVQ